MRKCCYIVLMALQGVNSAILFVDRTGYVYNKEPKGFLKVFLSPFSAGQDSKVLEQNQFFPDVI